MSEQTPVPRGSDMDLRIFQANVRHAGPCHDAALSIAFETNCDIVALQEPWIDTNQLCKRITKTHPQYQVFCPLTEWTIRPRVLTYIRRNRSLWPSQTVINECRDLMGVDVCLPGVQNLLIFNVYNAPPGCEDSGLGLQKLLSHTQNLTSKSCATVGDFNIRHHHWDHTTDASPGNGDELLRWASSRHLTLLNPPETPTHNRGGTLDLCFSNHPQAVCQVHHELHSGSDHETLILSLPLTHALTPPRGKLRFQSVNSEKLLHLISAFTEPVSNEPNIEARDLVQVIQTALEGSCPRARGNSKGAPWWNEQCKQTHQAWVRRRRHGPSDLESFAFRNAVRQAKRHYWRSRIESASSTQDVFQFVRWHSHQGKFQSPPLVGNHGLAISSSDKAKLLHETLLSRHLDTEDIPCGTPAEAERLIAWGCFTEDEVYNATCRTQSTTPGLDELPACILKLVWPVLKRRIVRLFQRCYDTGTHPDLFKSAEVVVLPKSGKRDRSSPKSYRPISLLPCLGKGLERLLARRIGHFALRLGILAPDQCGAVAKRSAVDLTTALSCDIQTAWDEKRCAGLLTMDVQGAFDGVLKGRLLHRLRQQGWPKSLISWTESFFNQRTAQIRLDDQSSGPFDILCGLPQGSPVSPILFLLYVEPVLRLSRCRFSYADDIAIMATGTSLEMVHDKLQEQLDLSLHWGRENGLLFDMKKTELQYFHKKRKYTEPPLHAGEAAIDPNDVTRWLGVFFDRKMTFTEHIRRAVVRSRVVTDHIKRLNGTSYGADTHMLRQATQSCAFSTLFYAAETWHTPKTTKANIGKCQTAMNHAARAVLPVYRTTPIPILLRETSWAPVEAWLERIHDRLAVRIATVDAKHPLRRRWNTSRFRWIRRNIPVHRAIDCSPPPWESSTRDSDRNEIHAVGRQRGKHEFMAWFSQLTDRDFVVFSDGSRNSEGEVGAGYAVLRGQRQVLERASIALGHTAEVFDAELIGAISGLRAALNNPFAKFARDVFIVLDNEEAAIRLHSRTPTEACSNAINDFQQLCDEWPGVARMRMGPTFPAQYGEVKIRWCPAHLGIEGNELADRLAKEACTLPSDTHDMTITRARRSVKERYEKALHDYWGQKAPTTYQHLGLEIHSQPVKELKLPRRCLGRLLAARSGHGDFAEYHDRYSHTDANRLCTCGKPKSPVHFFFCKLGQRREKLAIPNRHGISSGINWLLGTPPGAHAFARWSIATSFFWAGPAL